MTVAAYIALVVLGCALTALVIDALLFIFGDAK